MTITGFSFPTAIKFGPGARKLVADHLKEQGLNRPLIVTDKALAALPITAAALDTLEAAGFLAAGFFAAGFFAAGAFAAGFFAAGLAAGFLAAALAAGFFAAGLAAAFAAGFFAAGFLAAAMVRFS